MLTLTDEEQQLLAGASGRAVQKSMEILVALGRIYGARRLLPVRSVQIAGVSYDNLGDAGLSFLRELAVDGRARVLATLNPAGMDVENHRALGISDEFYEKQTQVLDAFSAMGILPTCTCTPYFIGNLPRFGEHVAWAESSAVCFANAVLGARTNREGGPSALAAALTGRTPDYGLHQDAARAPQVTVEVRAELADETDWGALGALVGGAIGNRVPLFEGATLSPTTDELKALCASIATFGGTAMFHIPGVTPERVTELPTERIVVEAAALAAQKAQLSDPGPIDFVSIGCPHASLDELRTIAAALDGKTVTRETWIHVARPVADTARRSGIIQTIEASGAKVACDTCMVVAPLKGRFHGLCTNSAKCVYYGRGKNQMRVRYLPLAACLHLCTAPHAEEPTHA